MLAFGDADGRVMMVDEATGEEKWSIQAHSLNYKARVAMAPDGRFVASVGFNDDSWKIFFAASGELHREVATHVAPTDPYEISLGRGLRAVAFSPCGQRLATQGSDGAVVLWDVRTGEAERRIQGFAGDAWAIAFTADGARVASGTCDEKVDVFDATTGALLCKVGENFPLTCVSFSPTTISMLATTTRYKNDSVCMWDIDSGDMIKEIEGCIMVAIFSPDGRTIASASAGDDVLLMDTESGEMRFRMVGHENTVNTASWCPYDGSELATGSADGTYKVWDSSTGELLRSTYIGQNGIESVVWGRDWVRDTQGAMAFAMGHHSRLGAESQVLELEAGVVRMILDRV